MFRKTPAVAKELGIRYSRIVSALRYGKLDPPGKDTSGDFVWTDADVARLKEALQSATFDRRFEKKAAQ